MPAICQCLSAHLCSTLTQTMQWTRYKGQTCSDTDMMNMMINFQWFPLDKMFYKIMQTLVNYSDIVPSNRSTRNSQPHMILHTNALSYSYICVPSCLFSHMIEPGFSYYTLAWHVQCYSGCKPDLISIVWSSGWNILHWDLRQKDIDLVIAKP